MPIGKAAAYTAVLPEQIVTGGAAALYVLLRLVPKILDYRSMIVGGCGAQFDMDVIASGDHLAAQHLDSLRLGQVRFIGGRLNVRRPLH